jgi:hypothetical protein
MDAKRLNFFPPVEYLETYTPNPKTLNSKMNSTYSPNVNDVHLQSQNPE